jgi:DNA-binding MarR family transcriptional regulator
MIELSWLIHQPNRLYIMAALVALPSGEGLDFVTLKSLIQLTDGNLSSHLSTLEQAGYVSLDKSFEGKKPKTRIVVTTKGREAFSKYIEELEKIIKGA